MESSKAPSSLFNLFHNSIIFHHTCPYLRISSLLKLAATSKSFRYLVLRNSDAFRYLDLSTAKGATVDLAPIDRGGTVWRSQRIDESSTEEDFYCGPLRGIFSFFRKMDLLSSVRTLILDGQSAPAEILREIICDDHFQVQILSVIGAKNLNENKFQQVLRYAVRPGRAETTPRLKGVYIFGTRLRPTILRRPPESSSNVTDSPGAQLGVALNRRSHEALRSSFNVEVNPWYCNSGKVIPRQGDLASWGDTLKACQGIIFFDAVLCRGPRHDHVASGSGEIRPDWIGPRVASIALKGCEVCHSLPEGYASSADAPSERLPLLSPVPKHSLSIRNAQQTPPPLGADSSAQQLLFTRCSSCCQERWCEGCGRFWCEDHYDSGGRTYTQGQSEHANTRAGGPNPNLKVHLGLCVEQCLINELYQGSDGMWA